MTEPSEGLIQSKSEHSNQIDIEALIAERDGLRASKERILDESKTYKAKFNEAKEKLELQDKAKMVADGELEKLLHLEREKITQLKGQVETQNKSLLMGNIKSALGSIAKDAHSIDDLLRMPEASNIQYDEDTMEIDLESVQNVAKGLRESKGYLFGNGKIANQASGTPAGSGESTSKPKSLKKMTNEEIKEALLKM